MKPRAAHKVLQPRDEAVRRREVPPMESHPGGGDATQLIANASQVLTLAGRNSVPRTGDRMADLGIIEDGAVAVRDGLVAAVGPSTELASEFPGARVIDAHGGVVMPGFVDAHTHLVFAGDRVEEADMKAAGMTYAEIVGQGGGILKTVASTRNSSDARLRDESLARLDAALDTGTTSLEAKTGYGLAPKEELRLLDVLAAVDASHPIAIVPTLMAAHAIPPEYEGRREEFLQSVTNLLPLAAERGASYCDVFCEEGYFTVDESRDLLVEGRRYGLDAKLHADELTSCGGAELAGEIGAVSADHLLHASETGLRDMAEAMVVAVLLPGTSLTTGGRYAKARDMIRAGVPVALGTDVNPNCWITSMPMIMALAVYRLGLTAAEAIVASTMNAAHAVGLANHVGSLEVGKAADILILSADDYRRVPYRIGANPVRAVLKDGVFVRGAA